jgi:hypothetical protein
MPWNRHNFAYRGIPRNGSLEWQPCPPGGPLARRVWGRLRVLGPQPSGVLSCPR